MGVLKHLVKLLAALFLSLFASYAFYRALRPLDVFFSNLIGLGLMMSLPLTLILLFYGRVQWAKYTFAFTWVAYLMGVWAYMFTGMSAVLPSYFWIPVIVILVGGIALLAIWKRKEFGIPWPLEKSTELKMEEFEKEPEKHEASGRLEERRELLTLIDSLSNVECRILLTLLESERQYSKKELQSAIKTTYPRVLRAVDELSRLGLVEVTELPRRERGAPVQHVVRASEYVVENEAKVRELIRGRLMKLEEARSPK